MPYIRRAASTRLFTSGDRRFNASDRWAGVNCAIAPTKRRHPTLVGCRAAPARTRRMRPAAVRRAPARPARALAPPGSRRLSPAMRRPGAAARNAPARADDELGDQRGCPASHARVVVERQQSGVEERRGRDLTDRARPACRASHGRRTPPRSRPRSGRGSGSVSATPDGMAARISAAASALRPRGPEIAVRPERRVVGALDELERGTARDRRATSSPTVASAARSPPGTDTSATAPAGPALWTGA